MDGAPTSDLEAVRALAVAYCDAVHHARADVFAAMCHDGFAMYEIGAGTLANTWDKPGYLARVAARNAFPGAPSYDVLSVDLTGDEMARVHLWVDVPPKRYEDHLGFVKVDGGWMLLTKVFRTIEDGA